MAERIYLTTSFKEKDKVKALGARWDASAGRWYVPEHLDVTRFAVWLPVSGETMPARVAPTHVAPAGGEVTTAVKGVPLSRLLTGVAALVADSFREGVWTTAEVLKSSVSKGHYYLELSERNEQGEVLAQARAVIWARTAQTLLAEFRRATGADLDAGIKVMLRAKPVFKAQYGFSLEVDGIDPSYTLGDLEARKRDIRERLKREGLFERNKRLPAPWDFTAVLVVAPERAAGLGDFAKEAQRLDEYGVCQFSYCNSRFQGEGAAGEIVEAINDGLRTWSGPSLPDAIVIIRGGGSVNDLAWLNDYNLARCVCECPVPVLTGVGHERDDTSIDEVAHRRFDTPSKVIAGIEDVVRLRAREARSSYESVMSSAKLAVASASKDALLVRRQIEQSARATVSEARSGAEALLNDIRHDSVTSLGNAREQSRASWAEISADARRQVALAKQSAPGLLSQVSAAAADKLAKLRSQVDATLPLVLERAATHTQTAKRDCEQSMRQTVERVTNNVSNAADRAEALFREIAGQGPQKTLKRGFAVVRSVDGNTLTAAATVARGATIEVKLHDGTVDAVVSRVTPNPRKSTDDTDG